MTKSMQDFMIHPDVESHYMVNLSSLNTLIVDFSKYDKGIITIITLEKYDEGTYILFDLPEFNVDIEGQIDVIESLSDGYSRWTVLLGDQAKHMKIKVVKGTQLT